MYRLGHYGVALLVWAPIGYVLARNGHAGLAVFGGGAVVALTPLPDYDQRVPVVEHRGITHTFAFAAVVSAVSGAAGWWVGTQSAFVRTAYGPPAFLASVGAVVGGVAVLAHLAADVVTPAGIEPFRPVSGRNYTLGWVRAANDTANHALFLAGLFATGAVAALAAGVV